MCDYNVTIRNNYKDSGPRTYCVAAEAPVVNDGDIKPPELRIPVCHLTDPVAYESQIKFSFTDDYYGFIGVMKKNRRQRDEISLRSQSKVQLGSDLDNGTKLNASVDGAPEVKPDTIARAKKGTFKILCTSKPAHSRQYVVGLARVVENDRDDPVPVAAVPYQHGKEYTFRPRRNMCIRRGDDHAQEVVGLDRVTYSIPLELHPSDVLITENDRGEFIGPDGRFLLPSIRTIDPPDRPDSAPPRLDMKTRPTARLHRRKPRLNEKAIKEGFTSNRQFFAYEFLRNFNTRELAGHHDDDSLHRIARQAENWGHLVSNIESLQSDMMDNLLVLTLYDCILLLDNSSSMECEEERIDQLINICETVVRVESIFENTPNVKVQFLNGSLDDAELATPEHVEELLENTEYHGPTRLGVALREKILRDRVYKLGDNEQLRPLLVSIITDGKPEWEPQGQLKHEMLECKRFLKNHPNLGDKHVLFQISQVGHDHKAARYLHSLEHDPELKRIVHSTSLDLDIVDDAEHPIEQYSDAIQTLAGAALVDFADYREENWNCVGIH